MNPILIENKAGKIRLNDVVAKPTIERLMTEISKLFGASAASNGADFGELTNCLENAVDTLEIEINSPGGSIFDGYDLHNEILSLRGRGVYVTATITGVAASMASVIAMAADKIRMVPHGRIMIHDASNGVQGNAAKLREMADLLDSISNDIAAIYAKRTGKTDEEMRDLMKKETWMNAKEAIAGGFADELFDIRPGKAISGHMNLIERLKNPSNEESIERITALESAIANHDAEVEDFKAKLEIAEAALQEAAGFKAEIEDLSAKLAAADELANSNAQTIADLQAKIVDADELAAKKVTETLASIGQPDPVEIGTGEQPKSHLETFQSLKGAEATTYFNANEKAIRAELRKAK